MKRKRILLWIIGLLITLLAAVYQKVTGPTYPKKTSVTLNGKEYKLKLLRSHGGEDDATISLNIDDTDVKANLMWKLFPPKETEPWNNTEFTISKEKNETVLTAKLPHQPPAGKIMYYISLTDKNGTKDLFKEKPIVIRFKGAVPLYILIPHIFFMFFAMFLATVSGLFAAFKISQFKRYANITFVLLILGGLILGPIVQKFAFLEYWAGVPFGWDLTDNKVLIAFIAWLFAFILNIEKENKLSVIIASVVTIIIFSIPHSMYGSELNRETGKVIQGFIQLYF